MRNCFDIVRLYTVILERKGVQANTFSFILFIAPLIWKAFQRGRGGGRDRWCGNTWRNTWVIALLAVFLLTQCLQTVRLSEGVWYVCVMLWLYDVCVGMVCVGCDGMLW